MGSLAQRRAVCRFNPRPREGANVSNHSDLAVMKSFNPRPREGANLQQTSAARADILFQSAPP